MSLSANTTLRQGKHCWKIEKTMLEKKICSVKKALHSWVKTQMWLMHQAYSIFIYYTFSFNNETQRKATLCEPIEKNTRKDIISILNYFLDYKKQCFMEKMCKQPLTEQLLLLEWREKSTANLWSHSTREFSSLHYS